MYTSQTTKNVRKKNFMKNKSNYVSKSFTVLAVNFPPFKQASLENMVNEHI